MPPLPLMLLVMLGGALGTGARYAVSGLVAGAIGETFPWGTLIINITGSFIIGFVFTLTAPDGRLMVSGGTRQFIMTGFCGGYTTFSSFSLQTLNLIRSGEWGAAGANIGGSVVLCMIGVWLGSMTASMINQLKGA
ncbi:CrcB protein [Rhizomicrobium palustre]|uniref:Fluoride-specific ion channel FluC n=1 Tax=Rhizomicrobium palustre TaxID=189966 RepID=A0A846N2M7_9PROT|nr:fluoride efflux transporter CrcB [Rhizomicrobium palustre]NIK90254.1 CrcB protein [Rhizomicrobium palustre]